MGEGGKGGKLEQREGKKGREEKHVGGEKKTPICVLLSAAFTLNGSESEWLRFTGSTSPHTVEDISFQSSISSILFCTQTHTQTCVKKKTQKC